MSSCCCNCRCTPCCCCLCPPSAFGGLVNTLGGVLTLAAAVPLQVPLNAQLRALNVAYTPVNSMTIGVSGLYRVAFELTGTPSAAATATVSVRVNGTASPALSQTRLLTAGATNRFFGEATISLNAGDIVDLSIVSNAPITMTLPSVGNSAFVTVSRVG